MAKKKEEKPEVKPETPKEEKRFFPKLLLLFGLVIIVLAVMRLFGFYDIPEIAIDIILLLAGLWLLKIGIGEGFYKRRKDIFKKYI